MIFNTKVAGIPCHCEVNHYHPGFGIRLNDAAIEDAEPPEEPEFEFTILDNRKRPAPWLARKLRPSDEHRLFNEYQLELQAEFWSERIF